MSTYSTTTTTTSRNLVFLGLLFFFLRIQRRVEARGGAAGVRSPFITPEFAIPEMADDDDVLFDDNDSPLLKTRIRFFLQRINIIKKPDPIPPPPSPPTTPPSPVPGTEPLVVEEETDNASNTIINENLEKSVVPTMNERDDDVSIDETIQQSDASSSSPSSKTRKSERYFSFAKSDGRLGFEVQSSTVNGSKRKRSTATAATVFSPSTSKTTSRQTTLWRSMGTTTTTTTSRQMSTTKTSTVADTDAIELSFDASSIWNLAILIANGTATTGFAVLGTLRLLAPMLLARRVLLYMLNVASDWYTGRYLRTTYKKMEHQYFRYYQVPAALRSFGRLSILSIFMMTFGRILEWVVGLRYPPCRIVLGGGCHWWCGLLWITTIVITGRMCGTFLATFMGGPLRLEVCNEAANNRNRRRVKPHRFFLTHISNIIHWMLDPDQVIREIVNSSNADLKPFHPDGGLFPATWGWLLILQTIACTREMSRNSRIMHSIMRQVLIQQALHDEWYRVLILERRVALGAVLISLYFVATIGVFWTVGTVDGVSALLTLPTVCAVMVSTWMNIFFYFERRVTRKRLTADPGSLQ